MGTATKKKPKKKTGLKTETPAKILNRIRELRSSIQSATKMLSENRLSLWQNVYLYVETVATKEGLTQSECFSKLSDEVGLYKSYWRRSYKSGAFIRDYGVDTAVCKPSALGVVVAHWSKLGKADLKFFVGALNRGERCSVVSRELAKRGYHYASSLIPSRQQIRETKKKWKDWQPELDVLASYFAETLRGADGLVEVTISVDGKDVITGQKHD